MLRSIDQISIVPWAGLAIAQRAVLAVIVAFIVILVGEVLIDETLSNLDATLTLVYVIFGIPLLIVIGPLFGLSSLLCGVRLSLSARRAL